jgi:hypothetical protein
MGHKVYALNGAGIVAQDDDMPKVPKRFQTKDVELSAVHNFFQNPALDRESNPHLIF